MLSAKLLMFVGSTLLGVSILLLLGNLLFVGNNPVVNNNMTLASLILQLTGVPLAVWQFIRADREANKRIKPLEELADEQKRYPADRKPFWFQDPPELPH